MAEVLGFRASGDCGSAEGVVFVVGYDGSAGIEIFGNVSVAVIRRVIGAGAAGDGEQAADSARALHGAAQVHAPGVGFGQCGSAVFRDGVPAVVDGELGGGADCLCDAAGLGVVDEVHGGSAGDLRLDEAIFSVPDKRGVGIDVGGEWTCGQVSVVIVDGVERINRGVLVEGIGGVVVRYREGEAVGGF